MIGKQDMKIRGSGLSPFRKKLRNNLNSSVHGNLRGMPAKGTLKKWGSAHNKYPKTPWLPRQSPQTIHLRPPKNRAHFFSRKLNEAT